MQSHFHSWKDCEETSKNKEKEVCAWAEYPLKTPRWHIVVLREDTVPNASLFEKGCKSISVLLCLFFFPLGSVLSSSWGAPDSAAYCRRMHGEPCFMCQKKCHEAVTEAAQWQTAQKTGGQLQLGNGTQGAVLHKELAAFSPFFQCAVHPQCHLGTLFLLCCHVSTVTQQTGSQQRWWMQKDNCHGNYVFVLVMQCNVKLPSNNNNIVITKNTEIELNMTEWQ